VRSYFKEVEEDDSPRDKGVKPHLPLIFNSKSPATKEELLAALPERSIVNRLIYRYFNSSSPALRERFRSICERLLNFGRYHS
jgi:hypothetical protein